MRRYKRSAAYRKRRSEFMKRWWYEKKHGIPHRPSKPVVPVWRVSVKLPPHYDAEFWELLNEKCRKYEERQDKGKLYILGGIRARMRRRVTTAAAGAGGDGAAADAVWTVVSAETMDLAKTPVK